MEGKLLPRQVDVLLPRLRQCSLEDGLHVRFRTQPLLLYEPLAQRHHRDVPVHRCSPAPRELGADTYARYADLCPEAVARILPPEEQARLLPRAARVAICTSALVGFPSGHVHAGLREIGAHLLQRARREPSGLPGPVLHGHLPERLANGEGVLARGVRRARRLGRLVLRVLREAVAALVHRELAVVDLTRGLVGEGLEGLRDDQEGRVATLVLVRVHGQGLAPVGAPNLGAAGLAAEAQDLIAPQFLPRCPANWCLRD
mmetsp:Transcript_42515/g.135058  ORF Transcript_42515/g.135058 Transcript_42515/m.135058 type:complete len:259 (-) Transcript_42515:335-1111(-)